MSAPTSVIPRLARRAEGSHRCNGNVRNGDESFDIAGVMYAATLALRDPSTVCAARDDTMAAETLGGRL